MMLTVQKGQAQFHTGCYSDCGSASTVGSGSRTRGHTNGSSGDGTASKVAEGLGGHTYGSSDGDSASTGGAGPGGHIDVVMMVVVPVV